MIISVCFHLGGNASNAAFSSEAWNSLTVTLLIGVRLSDGPDALSMPETAARTCQSLKARIVLPEDLQRRRLVQVSSASVWLHSLRGACHYVLHLRPPAGVTVTGTHYRPLLPLPIDSSEGHYPSHHVLPDSCYNRYVVVGTSNPSTAILVPTVRGALLHVRL